MHPLLLKSRFSSSFGYIDLLPRGLAPGRTLRLSEMPATDCEVGDFHRLGSPAPTVDHGTLGQSGAVGSRTTIPVVSYYVRCFCANATVPTLQAVLTSLVKRYPGLRIESPADLNSPDWKEAQMHYKESKPPIDVEVNRSSDSAKKIEGALGQKRIVIVSKGGGAPKEMTLEELSRNAGRGRNPTLDEVTEFKELLEEIKNSPAKRQVISHLNRTRFIVACRLPTTDIDDDGYDVNGDFLGYFVDHCEGMIQADGEGFYRGAEVLLAVE